MSFVKKNWSLCLVGLFLITALIYVLVMGDNIYALVWDNLDGGVAQLKMLGDNHLFFAWNKEVPFLGGIPRKYVYFSEFEIYNLLYAVLPAFVAYVASFFISIVLSILGACYLGKSVLGEIYTKYKHVIILVSFLFGMIPVYPLLRFAFASQPLFLGIMYNFYRKPNWKLWIAIFLYPMLSDMSRIGIFLCGYTLLFFIIEWIITKKAKWHIFGSVFVLGIGYLLVEWRLVYMMFVKEPMSRDEYVLPTYDIKTAWDNTLDVFVNGQIHAGDFHKYIILPICIAFFIAINVKYLVKKNAKQIIKDKYNWFFLIIIVNCIVMFLDNWVVTRSIISALPIVGGLSLYRAVWLNAFLWYLELAIVVARLTKHIKLFAYLVVVLQFGVICLGPGELVGFNDLSFNVKAIPHIIRYGKGYDTLFSFKEYYAEDLFDEIKADIGYNGEYCFAFCLEPSVLEYNDMPTIDGNSNCYPLSYKNKWKKFIAPVLEVRTDYAEAFDNKGIYAFAYSPDINHEAVKDIGITESELMIDSSMLEEMGGKYIFSRVTISNADELGIEFIGQYSSEDTPYIISVYKY